MKLASVDVSLVNSYLAHKQHLSQTAPLADVAQVTRDIVALHATSATSPYFSLWARVPGFQREILDDALYERREMVRALCMRSTLHIIPSDELAYFLQAFSISPAELRNLETLLVNADLCQKKDARAHLSHLSQQVLETIANQGPFTVRTLSHAVPELQTKIQHDIDKPYAGEFSIGSRLVPSLCAQGLLVRSRPRGTWRSNLYEYAALSDWLPDVDLRAVSAQEARTWLVRRYVAAFGPVSPQDIQWWTGFSKRQVEEALGALEQRVIGVRIKELGDRYVMLTSDFQQLQEFDSPEYPYTVLLPILDPYIMGYRDRRRFLAPTHLAKVLDRAGNAVPTVWVNGRVAGVWGQREDGSVTYGLFEPVGEEELSLLAAETKRLEVFLRGEQIPTRVHTPFTRALA